jgi:hypothetical protein
LTFPLQGDTGAEERKKPGHAVACPGDSSLRATDKQCAVDWLANLFMNRVPTKMGIVFLYLHPVGSIALVLGGSVPRRGFALFHRFGALYRNRATRIGFFLSHSLSPQVDKSSK